MHASAVLAQIPRPRGFVRNTKVPCADGLGESKCFTTKAQPRLALDRALDALVPLGLTLQKNACDDPSKLPPALSAAMGKAWLPCSAYGRLSGQLDVSIVAFPAIDHGRSTNRHLVFGTTQVSVEISKPLS